ncbi:hypothetical protein QN277_005850 [Acacia crassicarpa]|uniref:non-specific serine/threonine protein kinase n=1 Tax=Acacia crassicarpa TaxID=499986 RepID=A0AAE1IX47_9FABA|nr:hypothetical protein QN277_005850 [Acacia crassicarpa]
MLAMNFFAFLIIALSSFKWLRFAESKLPQQEVDALQEIISTMGSTHWKFDGDSCQIEVVGLTLVPPSGSKSSIGCQCFSDNVTNCHVVSISLKGYSLPGVLPPQLVKLPYLKEVDFALNYLNGTIPKEWTSMNLSSISLLVNRLSGEVPKELGKMTSLTYLNLESNQFTGLVPPELGNLINLQTLILSSNKFSGHLPVTYAQLKNLTDFRINDNNFSGTIPNFIQNWKLLQRLEMHGSGLQGPIPSNISLLSNLQQLRISDIVGPSRDFPSLSNMTALIRLVLRNCNITGELPAYIWTIENLEMLDVSFNKLVGEIPTTVSAKHLKFVFLTGNMLSGSIPDSILKAGSNVDLSYNNLTLSPEQSVCQDNLNLNINLFQSSSRPNDVRRALPCTKNFRCPRYSTCLHINSGGKDVTVVENKKQFLYVGDGDELGGTAKFYYDSNNNWGFSSTGDFMDDNDFLNTRYTAFLASSYVPNIYATARISPISLTYFHYCLENGNYTVNLHFAEIQFTNDKTYNSLGKRIFDIYVQGILVRKDFNIEDEAHSAQKPIKISIYNVDVRDNVLDVRFYWAGKGTTRIPNSGVYGPLVSALSIVSESKRCPDGLKRGSANIIIGVAIGVGAFCLMLFMAGVFWWRRLFRGKSGREKGAEGLDTHMGTYSLQQIRDATDDFNPDNKLGEGGFGPVYKGQLSDGTWVAVKQLSSKSRQGNREFLTEFGMISCLQHPNLVKLHGCCIEGDQLLLVYEYMENNNLARALFSQRNQLKLDWPTRLKICIGIAKGLAFLHEESALKIVHRDIKATNVLLDENLNPKISDFGLARLNEEEKTHISTRVAGTIGYMAPEYALWGYLTYKADVYSFGVVVLEIISGKSNNECMPSDDCVCLLEWACHLHKTESMMQVVDERLGSDVNPKEVEVMLKVAILCTNASPSLRPMMSEVVNMLEGRMSIPEVNPEQSAGEDLRFKALRDIQKDRESQSVSTSQTENSNDATVNTSTSDYDLHGIRSEP